MPNWCSNTLSLSHPDSTMIDRVEKAVKEDKLFSEFYPCPKELTETKSGFFGNDGYQAELQKFTEELNIKHFGYRDWYDWNCANWGTKWEAAECIANRDDENLIFMSFDTAWSPPIAFYEKLCELGFSVEAMYYESGCAYCGTWEDGIDDCYTIEGNSKWVEKHIPRGLDDEFCISMGMAEWEDDADYTNQEQA